jgi:hypothetical protein
MALKPLQITYHSFVFIVIDPAAGGPQSDYAIVSIVRERGSVTVSQFLFSFCFFYATDHKSWHWVVNLMTSLPSLLIKFGTACRRRFMKKLTHFCCCAGVSLSKTIFFM